MIHAKNLNSPPNSMTFVPASQSIMYRNNYDHHQDSHFPSPSSNCAPQDFHGVSQFLMRRSMSSSGMEHVEEPQPDDDMSDDGSTMLGEKKRRLNLEQVKALEKSFELGNKLEPERKMQLARALGLQPRQVAIWFQNRRARWKTKQLERDYDVLKRQFEVVKADNDSLKSQNDKLQSQLMGLKSKEQFNLNKDNEGSWWSNGSDENSCDHVNLNNNTTATAATGKSTLYPHSTNNKNAVVFPSSTTPVTSLTQLLQTSSSSSRPDHHSLQLFHKIDHVPASNDAFCNVMFGGIEENPEFWSWSEQHNYQ